MKKILGTAAVLAAFAGVATADGIIVDPGNAYAVGINSGGSLFTDGTYNTRVGTLSYVGFQRLGDGYDPINPGTPTEGWPWPSTTAVAGSTAAVTTTSSAAATSR